MGSSYHYYLYFPRSATEQVLKDLVKRSAPMEERCSVRVILPGGREVVLSSWSDSLFPDSPIYDTRTEPIRWIRTTLVVDVARTERRQFRNAMTDARGNAVLPLQLALDFKLDLPGSFAQVGLGAYTTSTSYHFSSDSFHHLMAQILSANDGLCAILDYERGVEASLRWLRDGRVVLPQPIPRQCESLDEELNPFTKTSRFSSLNESLELMRRFDHAIEQWLMVF